MFWLNVAQIRVYTATYLLSTVQIFVVVVVVVVIEKGRDAMFGTKAAELFKKSDTPYAAFARESTHF